MVKQEETFDFVLICTSVAICLFLASEKYEHEGVEDACYKQTKHLEHKRIGGVWYCKAAPATWQKLRRNDD